MGAVFQHPLLGRGVAATNVADGGWNGVQVFTAVLSYYVQVMKMERNPKLTHLSRELRKNQTKEESLLWYNFLRLYKPRFHRQYVIGNYIVDFYCHKAKIAVELDGSQHYDPTAMENDHIRTHTLQEMGITVLRFTNLEVKRNFNEVCEVIDREVQKRASL